MINFLTSVAVSSPPRRMNNRLQHATTIAGVFVDPPIMTERQQLLYDNGIR